MNNFESNQILFSQKLISLMGKVSTSKVSRYVSSNNIEQFFDGSKKLKKYDLPSTHRILEAIRPKNKIYKKVHSFYNFKGGTGKTSICFQSSLVLSFLGYKVLVVDLDPQAHLSYALRFDEDEKFNTMYDVIIGGAPIDKAIQEVIPGLDCIPANLSMTRLEVPLSQKTKREEVLKKILKPLSNKYDFIFLDTNPTISTLNMNALVASDHINVICETQPFSLSGLAILVEEIESFYDDMDKQYSYKILPNKYESKTATAQEVLGVLRSDYGEHVYASVVRKCEDFNISAKLKLPLLTCSPLKSIAVEDVMDFSEELIKISSIEE